MTDLPFEEHRPAPRIEHGHGVFEQRPEGVVYVGPRNAKDPTVEERWICSPLEVVAETCNADGLDCGLLLRFLDGHRKPRLWPMPLETMQGDGMEYRRELARCGLRIGTGKTERDLLSAYIRKYPASGRATCVGSIGWHGDRFVLPGASEVPPDGDMLIFQNATGIAPAFGQAGTARQWTDEVSALASGNPLATLAVSIAFSGALLHPAGISGGGWHLVGKSSSGKSTLLALAASVFGHPDRFMRTWRATVNGLEGVAAAHNDCVLILDELSQIEPAAASMAAYMLANGQGKARATKLGTPRPVMTWRVNFLSSGEIDLADSLASAGASVTAGQTVRMVSLDADDGADMGCFADLHGRAGPDVFSAELGRLCRKHHGAAGVEWIRLCVAHRAGDVAQFAQKQAPDIAQELLRGLADPDGEVRRTASRFALAAAAGELAQRHGLVAWQPYDAFDAARKHFLAWVERRGGARSHEENDVLRRVEEFVDMHSASQMTRDDRPDEKVLRRVGWWHDALFGREWWFLPEPFKTEVLKGCNLRFALDVLRRRGWIQPSGDRLTQVKKIAGMTRRVYVIPDSAIRGHADDG